MNNTIENIWKKGFIEESKLIVPKINNLYGQRSIDLVQKQIRTMRFEVWSLLPLGALFFLISYTQGQQLWAGAASAGICLIWFFISKKQVESIEEIDYDANCYQYLINIRKKLDLIFKMNLRYTIFSTVLILFPMLVYTYINKEGQTLGEIFGWTGIDLHRGFMFLIIPIVALFAYGFFLFMLRIVYGKIQVRFNRLIADMEELQKGEE